MCLFTVCSICFAMDADELVQVDEEGRLVYGFYANRGEKLAANRLPDFSRSGYAGGGIALPSGIEVREIVEPAEGDRRAVIQAAIDRVSALPLGEDGFRGAVLLKAGRHSVKGSLFLRADGVLLIGEGQNTAEGGGTELVATLAEKHNFIQIEGSSEAVFGPRLELVDRFVGAGASQLRVVGAETVSEGQCIQIVMTPNQAWVEALDTAQYGWVPEDYEIAFERRVVGVEGDVLELDSPLVQPLRAEYGGGFVRTFDPVGRVRNCGVENLMITSVFEDETDEDHGWIAVFLNRAEDCWVRRVTSRHFGYGCVTLHFSSFCTVEECAALDPVSRVTGGRRYSFNIEGESSFNLFQRIYARGGRHDVVTGSRVPGPNVFLDVVIEGNLSDPGPHHRYATGVLFDNVYADGVGMRVENRQDSGTGHGWSGAQVVFWNCKARDFVCDAPPGAMNFAFGFDGAQREGNWAPEEPSGIVVSGDPHLVPRSLYFAQLRDRLGWDAVLEVSDWRQVNGDIRQVLKEWKGLGELSKVMEQSYSASFANWLGQAQLGGPEDSYLGVNIVAREVFLGGVDLEGGVPILLEANGLGEGGEFLLSARSRLGLVEEVVVLECSEDLGYWEEIESHDYPMVADSVFDSGVRLRRWALNARNHPHRFFRLRLRDR